MKSKLLSANTAIIMSVLLIPDKMNKKYKLHLKCLSFCYPVSASFSVTIPVCKEKSKEVYDMRSGA